MSAQDIADVLLGTISESASAADITNFTALCSRVATSMGVSWFIDATTQPADAAMSIKRAVVDQFGRISAVLAIASSRGYALPDDPSPRFSQLNASRRVGQPLPISAQEASDLEQATYELSRIASGYDLGQITFERSSPAAQLASFEVSVDGISQQSGDPLADILGYQPDADSVKRKRALDALSLLDFSRRKPYMLFTADIIVDGRHTSGSILCWQRMRDASGYRVSRRDSFAMSDLPDLVLSNDSLSDSTAKLKADPNFAQLISFYDWLGPDDYVAFVDRSTRSNTLYSFHVTGFQTKSSTVPSIFDVPTSALYLSTAQADQVRSLIKAELAQFGKSDQDSVSPYPAISQVIYGDPGHGWILAGCNVLTSTRRGDSPDDTRKLSFLGSQVDSVLSLASAGKLVVPVDVGQVHVAVDSSVGSVGVSQTLLAIMDGTGLTIFISGKDDPNGISPSTDSLEGTAGGLAKIISAIDPQSATIDPQTLAASLNAPPTGRGPKGYVSRSLEGLRLGPPPPSLSSFLGTGVIDLTTYDGIDRFMRLIRSLYDFFPSSLT